MVAPRNRFNKDAERRRAEQEKEDQENLEFLKSIKPEGDVCEECGILEATCEHEGMSLCETCRFELLL